MALVKCPECGRENVSDTATSCPDCGYNIKAHYDKIKRDDEERIKAEEIRKQKEEKRKKDLAEKKRLEEVYKKEQEERERQEIEHKLEKQRNTKILYWCLGILVAVICVTMCIIGIQNENTEKALIELANNSFDADFESYKSALQGYGINIDATYEFGNMSYEEGVLSVDCIAPECLSGEEHLKECVAYFGRRAHTVRPLRVAYTSQYNIIKPKIPARFSFQNHAGIFIILCEAD